MSVFDAIVSTAPYLATIPTAYLVADAALRFLEWPVVIAIISGIVIETLGIATTATALLLYEYNGTKRKSDPKAPAWIAFGMVGVYFLAILALTVLINPAQGAVRFAPVVFPVLSLAGAVTLGLRSDHARMLEEMKATQDERRRERKERMHATQANYIDYKPAQKKAQDAQVPAEQAQDLRWAAQQLAHVCAVCGKSFAKQQKLAAHMRIHAHSISEGAEDDEAVQG
jgi:hypothetical protein